MCVLHSQRFRGPGKYVLSVTYKRYIVAGVTDTDILQIVSSYWQDEERNFVIYITKKLQNKGIPADIASKIAAWIVSMLKKKNGQSFREYQQIAENVNTLLSKKLLEELIHIGCEQCCRDQCVGVLLADREQCVDFAWKYMEVEFEHFKMRVGGKDEGFTLPKCSSGNTKYPSVSSDNIFVVSSPYPINELDGYCMANLPRRLKDKFKFMLSQKGCDFYNYERLTHNAEVTYVEKAYHVLLHKFFEKSGISDIQNKRKLTMDKIRETLLDNIKYPEHKLTNFDEIDVVLEDILDFLSKSYIEL
jgi:hypothetical protein